MESAQLAIKLGQASAAGIKDDNEDALGANQPTSLEQLQNKGITIAIRIGPPYG